MTQVELENLIERNKRLEYENRVLRDRFISSILSENTEITRLNFEVERLEKKVKCLSEENIKLKLFS